MTEKEKPSVLKELFKGTKLDGYVEAARVRTLDTWFPQVKAEKIDVKEKK